MMGFPGPNAPPVNMKAQIFEGELYLRAADVVELLRERARECDAAAAEGDAKLLSDSTDETFLSAVAYRVVAEDYRRRADWLDVAVIEALPMAGQGS
jgi:hypothetical protein